MSSGPLLNSLPDSIP
ncbi:hypothetical protein A2U01_0104267, partial [Trifolium medium]|nr:hypothetical protein [Trifolium medium]